MQVRASLGALHRAIDRAVSLDDLRAGRDTGERAGRSAGGGGGCEADSDAAQAGPGRARMAPAPAAADLVYAPDGP